MIDAPNSLNFNCEVRVMKEASGPSVSEEIADIFRNYNIDKCYLAGSLSDPLYFFILSYLFSFLFIFFLGGGGVTSMLKSMRALSTFSRTHFLDHGRWNVRVENIALDRDTYDCKAQ